MKLNFHIWDRSFGKTTEVIEKLNADPKAVAYIKDIHLNGVNPKQCTSNIRNLMGLHPSVIYIDEQSITWDEFTKICLPMCENIEIYKTLEPNQQKILEYMINPNLFIAEMHTIIFMLNNLEDSINEFDTSENQKKIIEKLRSIIRDRLK